MSNHHFNKGTAFTQEERNQLQLTGLLPPKIETLDMQRERCLQQFTLLPTPIEKYDYLTFLKDRNETLFYSLMVHNIELLLPIVYTPTVGDVCLEFGHIFKVAEGMYFCKENSGNIRSMLDNWDNEVDIIVVSDGSRILGLGDLGASGMGIPIGKLSLYVTAAGFHPSRTLPVLIDTGTNNEKFLKDPLYLGVPYKRLPDKEFYPLIDEFIMAVKDKWPKCLLQFEDFSNDHSFELLERYRNRLLCFNDDIQGTGAVIAGGFYNAVKMVGIPFEEQKLVFFGAGSASVGVANGILNFLVEQGMNSEAARKLFWLVDSKGLVTTNRGDKLQAYKVPFARSDHSVQLPTLMDVIKKVKPTALIGLSGIFQAFSKDIIQEFGKYSLKPIIFALSNPTSKAECSATQAYEWTEGRCIFASGTPFGPVKYLESTFYPALGNNMYVFPGLGFGAVLCKAKKMSDSMFAAATRALANCVTAEQLAVGCIYPKLSNIREISVQIAAAVIETAFKEGLAQIPKPSNISQFVEDRMYYPSYLPLNTSSQI